MSYQMWDSPEPYIKMIKTPEASFETIRSVFARLFRIGDEKEYKARLTMVDTVMVAVEQAQKAEPNSMEAIGAYDALHVYRMNESVREDTGLDRSFVVDLMSSIITDSTKMDAIAYDAYTGIGKTFLSAIPDDTAEKIKKVSDGIKYLKENIQTLTRETQQSFVKDRQGVFTSDEYKAAHKEYRNKIQAVTDGHQKYFNSDEFIALSYKERRKGYNSKNRLYKKEADVLTIEWKETEKPFFSGIDERANDAVALATGEQKKELESLEAERREHAQTAKEAILIKLFESSPISEGQAQEWVDNNVHVADNALARLKRSKNCPYKDVKSIKEDIKEFYRLTGGKLGRIKIITKGNGRATAHRQTGEIAVDSDFSKKTLFHEMGHHVEFGNLAISRAAQHYRKERAGDAKLMPLRTLSHRGYKSNEFAYPDGFFDPYVGKHYSDGSTEVISMGLQQLSSTDSVLDLLAKDREHLEMVVGMAAQQDEATRVLMQTKSIIYSGEIEKEGIKAVWEKELKRVASKKATDPYLKENRTDGELPYIEKPYRGNNRAVYFKNRHGEDDNYILAGIQDARNFIYLYLANEQELLPDYLTPDAIYRLVRFNEDPPEWFKKDIKLPKLGDK